MDVSDYEAYARKLRAFKRGEDVSQESLISDFTGIVEEFNEFKRKRGRQTYNALMSSKDAKRGDFKALIANYSAADTDHPFLRRCKKLDLMRHAASLKVSFSQRTRRMITAGRASCPEMMLQEKGYGYQFADILGVRRPKRTDKPVHFEELKFKPGTALKPPSGSGSSGVYLVLDGEAFVDVRQSKEIKGAENLRKLLREDVELHRVPAPEWHSEELIRDTRNPGNMSYDWKFYCFYGQVHRIGRIERFPIHRETWVNGDFTPTKLRKGLVGGAPIVAEDLPDGLLALAKKISRRIPAPFVRLDFMSSDAGPVLGELTARPGTFHLLDKETDQFMGDAFIKAEARLQQDLLNGKQFEAYNLFFEHRKDPEALFKSWKWLKRRVVGRAKREVQKLRGK